MKLFRIQESIPFKYQCDGEYTWHLPAVWCTTCGKYYGTNLGIPTLDIEGRLDGDKYRRSGSVPPDECESLAAPLRQLMNDRWPVLPGMGFGPFLGTVLKQEKRDFLWLFSRTLLLRESAFEALREAGISMTTGPAICKSSRNPAIRTDYRRVAQIWPAECMDEQTLSYAEHRRCPSCGLRLKTRPKRVFLRREGIPGGMDVFAMDDCSSVIVTEKFRDAAMRLRLTNICFEPVEIVM